MNNYFSSNIKFIRMQKGLTQEQFARMIDKDYSTVGKWENGSRTPIMEDVIKVADLLNIDVGDLLKVDLRLKKEVEKSNLYATTIYDDGEYSMEIKSDKQFETLSEEEKAKLIQQAMDELYEYKRSLKKEEK